MVGQAGAGDNGPGFFHLLGEKHRVVLLIKLRVAGDDGRFDSALRGSSFHR